MTKCFYCGKNRQDEKIVVFDVINGNVCDDCYAKYESDKKDNLLGSPFDTDEDIQAAIERRQKKHGL